MDRKEHGSDFKQSRYANEREISQGGARPLRGPTARARTIKARSRVRLRQTTSSSQSAPNRAAR